MSKNMLVMMQMPVLLSQETTNFICLQLIFATLEMSLQRAFKLFVLAVSHSSHMPVCAIPRPVSYDAGQNMEGMAPLKTACLPDS